METRIVTATDEFYIPGVVALAKSLLKYNYTLTVLYDGKKQKFGQLLELGCELIPSPVMKERVPGNINWITRSMYSRFFIPSLIQEPRVLYLDADTLVLKSLENLFNTSLESFPTGAVIDQSLGTMGKQRIVGVFSSLPAFNSGVLLMDTLRWKAYKIGETALRWLLEDPSSYPSIGDQAVLNHVHWGSFVPLSSVYNHSYRRPINNATHIIHWHGPKKPWHTTNCDFKEIWEKIYYE